MDTEKILGAIIGALDTIKMLADTPGVNLIPYATIVSAAAGAIKAGIAAGVNVAPYVDAIKKTFDGDQPTQAEMDALDAKISDLEAKVQAAPPPADVGEPE